MGGVLTLAVSVVAAAGAVAAFRYLERKRSEVETLMRKSARAARGDVKTLDYERDPATGVFRPRG
ncbi:MAG: hypothetical protein AAFW81_08620 [Pseudomonadota bacterium]